MNILIYVPQMAAFGGMERHVCDLARVLASRDHHVKLITTSNSLSDELRSSLVERGITLRELARIDWFVVDVWWSSNLGNFF